MAHPVRPRRLACWRVESRKKTPWTLPAIMTWARLWSLVVSEMSLPPVAVSLHLRCMLA